MKQFKRILNFELMNFVRNKVFVCITLFLVVAIILVMFSPRIIGFFQSGDDTQKQRPTMMVIPADEAEQNQAFIVSAFEEVFTDYDVQIFGSDTDAEVITGMVKSGMAQCAVKLNSLSSYTYYVNNLSLNDNNVARISSVLSQIYKMHAMVGAGVSPEDVTQILSTQIESKVENLGKDQVSNFMYTYIMIFALYMVLMLYGQMVASNVASEKSSRAMELLVTSAKPTSMMFGKVLASCIAGLCQLVAVFGTAIICFALNKSYWNENPLIASFFNIPIELFVYLLVFFVLGFLIYAFLYGAVGSMASKLEDINTLVMPISIVFVAAFIVVVTAITAGNVDSLLMKLCSYIPLTSPMAMFTRIAMSTVAWYEIVASIVILMASVVGVGFLSAKIYRAGVLMYGNSPSFKTIFDAIRRA